MRGKVLLFVATRQHADDLAQNLQSMTTAKVGCVHGEKSQAERSEVMKQFKKGVIHILVATDVASRGLDVSDIRTGREIAVV